MTATENAKEGEKDLLLCERYLHGCGWCYLESLKCITSSCGLHFVLELDERDVVATRHQSDLNRNDILSMNDET